MSGTEPQPTTPSPPVIPPLREVCEHGNSVQWQAPRELWNGDNPVALVEMRWCRDCGAFFGRDVGPSLVTSTVMTETEAEGVREP
jgi:hypothetical protein